MNITELELAQRIRDGTVPSPVKFSNMWLVNLRITGTGLAYRTSINEHVWRDPDIYLNELFLQRCNGLPVIKNHPDDAVLNDDEFASRIVGCVMLPYIKGDEVWAVCRIYSEEIVEMIVSGGVSTSPSVVFNQASGNVEVKEGDATFLIEGIPHLVDHIALVTEDHGSLGVWDKNKIPSGVEVSITEGIAKMDKDELQAIIAKAAADAASQALSGVSKEIEKITVRMDSLEQGAKARADAEEQAKKDAEEKAKADAEEKARADEEEAKKKADEEKAKADAEAAEKAKADAEAAEEKSKADAEEAKADEAVMAEEQVKADSAFSALGERAPQPMSGEKSMDYIKRTLAMMQKHSPTYKDADIRAIADAVVLKTVQQAIFDEARKTFEKEVASTPGKLVQVTRQDAAGRPVRTFMGDMNSWLSTVKVPPQKVVKFNNHGSIH